MKMAAIVWLLPWLVAVAWSGVDATRTRSGINVLCQRSKSHPFCIKMQRNKRSAELSSGDFMKDSLLHMQLPGTKWCGSGNIASSFDDLGTARDTDRCCRDHDSCPVNLESGETVGCLTNTGPYTVSSCQCDLAFFECLRRVGSEHSQLAGELYFNTLRPYCVVTGPPGRSCVDDRQKEQPRLRLVKGGLQGRFPDLPASDPRLASRAEALTSRVLDYLLPGQAQ